MNFLNKKHRTKIFEDEKNTEIEKLKLELNAMASANKAIYLALARKCDMENQEMDDAVEQALVDCSLNFFSGLRFNLNLTCGSEEWHREY